VQKNWTLINYFRYDTITLCWIVLFYGILFSKCQVKSMTRKGLVAYLPPRKIIQNFQFIKFSDVWIRLVVCTFSSARMIRFVVRHGVKVLCSERVKTYLNDIQILLVFSVYNIDNYSVLYYLHVLWQVHFF